MTARPPGSMSGPDELPGQLARAGSVVARFAVPLAMHVVTRPRLQARLTDAVAPCMLIAAPAGWGKTLLVSSWLAEGRGPNAAAWLSLDPTLDNPRAFWTALVGAILPMVGDRAAPILRNTVAADDMEQVPGQLAAALAVRGDPIVLVLDNLHEVTALGVHESLLRLIERPPPGLRFVVTTRRDPPWPLHQLRLSGLLTEIRASELAFRADEARTLLDQHGIDLDDEHLGRLVDRTEGWAAGLRLAALELENTSDPAGFVDAFSGDDHAVAAYLLDEVVERLAPELLDFLVRVSILDIVCADLADALTGRSNGAATLAELFASNLFVHAVGPGGRWFRLHRLLADVLRPQITQRRLGRDLHRRAAQWYLHHASPLDAVRYALQGDLWSLAAEIVGVYLPVLAVKGSSREIDTLLSRVPRDALLAHPELAAGLAGARLLEGSMVEVEELAATAAAGADGLSPQRAGRLRVILLVIALGRARGRGDFPGVARAFQQIPEDPTALAALGLAGWDVLQPLVLANAGTAEFWTGDHVSATKHLKAALNGNPSGELLRPHVNAAAYLALLCCERGDLDMAQHDAHLVVDRAAEAGWAVSTQVVAAYLTLARVALDRNDPSGADSWLGRVAEVEAVVPEPHVQLAAAGLAAMRRADDGDLEGALAGLQRTSTRLAATVSPALSDMLVHVEADLLCRLGDIRRAGELLAGLRGPATAMTKRAVARIHLRNGDLPAAQEVLTQMPQDGVSVRERVEGGVLRSLIAAPHDHDAALSWLEDALLSAAPVEMRRPFLVASADLGELVDARIEAGSAAAGFAVDLARRMSGPGRRPPAVQAAALTDREQLVLRYLASTLSNAEIASELYLSVNTVKSHQRMVYRKLGAAGRRDAVRRAKELRLL